MEEVDPMKETFVFGSLKVVLPIVDVFSDVAMTTKLYINDRPDWASLLLGPVLINYALCWFAWFTTEKQKKFTWIAALLGCYPQFVAARILWLFWTQPLKGMKAKKHFQRNLMEQEIFTEAVPTSFIMAFLMVFVDVSVLNCGDCRPWNAQASLIIGERGRASFHLFFVSLATSLLSAGMGLAKCLQVGYPLIIPSLVSLQTMFNCNDGDDENHILTMMLIPDEMSLLKRWGHVVYWQRAAT